MESYEGMRNHEERVDKNHFSHMNKACLETKQHTSKNVGAQCQLVYKCNSIDLSEIHSNQCF